MKILVQNFGTGRLSIERTPVPRPHPNGLLVRTRASLISAGTERAVIALARKGYVGKALDRPDLARKVIQRARTDGFWATLKVVRNLLADPMPLGYSLVGEVAAVSQGVRGFAVGDRVACAGLGHANHAEMAAVPAMLSTRVPDGVPDEQAAYVALGAIALQGVRQADQQVGATILVVGLGLVGQITVRLCRAAGYRVIGFDVDARKFDLARAGGAVLALNPHEARAVDAVIAATRGLGVDAAILTAAARDGSGLFAELPRMCRDRARVVVVGDIQMKIPRRAYFEKDLTIVQSRSYGPGRYDSAYEEQGHDYPPGYVRWTEQRNMEAFLDLIADRRVDVTPLTTHRFPIERAGEAYALITGEQKTSDVIVGVLLTYAESGDPGRSCDIDTPHPIGRAKKTSATQTPLGLGMIGAGQFAKGILLPALLETKGFRLVGVASARGVSAEAVRSRYRAAYATADASRVLADPEVEAVVIATRHNLHAPLAMKALRQGKHVFVEKPLALSLDELEQIRDAEAGAEGILQVGFNRRFSPLVGRLRDHFSHRTEPLAMIYRVNAGRIPLNSEGAWVHDPAVGGGRLVGEVCHFVDTLSAVCGARPKTVRAIGMSPHRVDLADDDTVTLVIGFDDGSVGTIHYLANGDAAFPKERLEAFGDGKVAVLDNFRSVELVAGGRRRRTRALNAKKGFREQALAFLQACRSGEAPIPIGSLIDTTLVTILAMEDLLGSS